MADTTEKFDVKRALFIERLICAWDKAPTQRLGQIVVEALEMTTPFDILMLRGIDDVDLAEKIERYVLMRLPQPPQQAFPEEEPPTRQEIPVKRGK